MALLNQRFPAVPGFKTVGGDTFNTSVEVTSGGQEFRNGNWAGPRRKYTISLITPASADRAGSGVTRLQFAQALRALFDAAQGKLNAFGYHDDVFNEDVIVRFDTDEFNIQIEPSDVAGGFPIISWNALVLIEVRPPNY